MKLPALICPSALSGLIVLSVLATGCRSLGPRTIPKDRADYSDAIGDSWMRQTLLNVVKLRYSNVPVFVDVASIVGGYTAETETEAGVGLSFPGSDSAFLSGTVRLTDRPTITYTPLTGNRFSRNLLMPIRPEQVFFAIQSGWNAQVILSAAVASINGLRNRELTPAGVSPAAPEFLRVAELLEKIKRSGAVGMRILQDEHNRQTTLVTFHNQNTSKEILEELAELRRLLRLSPTATEFRLVYGAVAAGEAEIAVRTRSLIQIMAMLAGEVEVPRSHVEQGRTIPGPQQDSIPLVRIRCTEQKPQDAAVAVKYRSHWFWIDDCDLASKRSFSFLMLLFTLADSGEQANLPLITIPAQ